MLLHTQWIVRQLDSMWQVCNSPLGWREIAAVAVTHLFAWLGLRHAMELFLLQWSNVKLTHPMHGPTIGLAMGVGTIELQLVLPKTKGNCTKVANIVISYFPCISWQDPWIPLGNSSNKVSQTSCISFGPSSR